KPIVEKTMIFRRFLFFGFAMNSLSLTRGVTDLFQLCQLFADKHCPSGPTPRLQVRSKIVNSKQTSQQQWHKPIGGRRRARSDLLKNVARRGENIQQTAGQRTGWTLDFFHG